MHGAAARRVGHTEVPDEICLRGATSLSSGWRRPAAPSRFADGPGLPSLAARARLAKRCFASGCAGPPRTPCAPCHTGAGAEVHVSAASARRVGYRMYPIQAVLCIALRARGGLLRGKGVAGVLPQRPTTLIAQG